MLAVAPSRDRRLRTAWVGLLERHEFDHIAHLTFKFERASIDFAFARLANWSNGLARLAQRPIAWAAFPEYTHPELVHLHALLVGTGDVPVETMTERWRTRNGRARIEPFEAGRGGEGYVTKAISARYSEGRFSSNFVRVVQRRRSDKNRGEVLGTTTPLLDRRDSRRRRAVPGTHGWKEADR